MQSILEFKEYFSSDADCSGLPRYEGHMMMRMIWRIVLQCQHMLTG